MALGPIPGKAGWLAVLATLAAGCSGQTTVDPEKLARITALQEQISRLEIEAERLEDIGEIKRLQRIFGYYLDNAMWDQLTELFADDGSIEIGLDGIYSGKERVRKYFHTLGGGRVGLREGELNEHFQLQPFITLSDDGITAKGRWRALIMKGQHGKQALWGEGPYENEYVKEDGIWKIKKVHWYQTFLVPYEGGWARNKDVNGGIFVSKELPPDQPPSEKYETWPSVYTPPFHYKNPVSGR